MSKVDWKKYDHLIGKIPNRELAAIIGVTHASVGKRKKVLHRSEGKTPDTIEEVLKMRDFEEIRVGYDEENPLTSTRVVDDIAEHQRGNVVICAVEEGTKNETVEAAVASIVITGARPRRVDMTRGRRAVKYWDMLIRVAEKIEVFI
jgi:hypothetical protein